MGKSTSPIPKVEIQDAVIARKEITFVEAIIAIANGEKITKLEWNNKKIYGYLKNEILHLHKEDGKDYQWILSKADIDGRDYIIITN